MEIILKVMLLEGVVSVQENKSWEESHDMTLMASGPGGFSL